MTKQEFLTRLKSKLSVLSADEIKDIIDEYSEYLNDKIAEGKTEQEAVHDFGDVDELAREILKAYKIDDEYTHQKDWSHQFNTLMTNAANLLNKVFQQILETLNDKGIASIIGKLITALIMCILLRIPLGIIQLLGEILLNVILPQFMEGIFLVVWRLACEFGALILSLLVILKIFNLNIPKKNPSTSRQIIDAEYTEKTIHDESHSE